MSVAGMQSFSSAPCNQLVILVGGKGTRLGVETTNTPKPLVHLGDGGTFLDFLLKNVARQGYTDIVLLAGHLSDAIVSRYDGGEIGNSRISVIVEPVPMGTGGAVRYARDALASTFILLNGDSFFDINIRALEQRLLVGDQFLGCLALHRVENTMRYGSVVVEDGRITRFREKAADDDDPGLINAGIYALRKEIIDLLPDGPSSIEKDLFPKLAERGALGGCPIDGFFIDIGIPETLAYARDRLPSVRRPALFLDRDGVINVDKGYVYKIRDFEWVDGAIETIRWANDFGFSVIVVTNQSGVGRGMYGEEDVTILHEYIRQFLYRHGAFIDDFYFCPYHEDALDPRYKIADHPDRKPNPGMLLKAAKDHEIDLSMSLLIGDNLTDLKAAAAAGVAGFLFPGGNLLDFVLTQINSLNPRNPLVNKD